MAMTIYRISRWLYLNGVRPVVWLLWPFNIYLSGTDMVPMAGISEHFYPGHCNGIAIAGKIGPHRRVFVQTAIMNLSEMISGINSPADLRRIIGEY